MPNEPTDREEPMKGLAEYLLFTSRHVCQDPRDREQLRRWASEVEASRQRPAAQAVSAGPEASSWPTTFREILDWRMCSDPWPGGEMQTVDEWLDRQSRHLGYTDWLDAYHALQTLPPTPPAERPAAAPAQAVVTDEREAFDKWADAAGFNIDRDDTDKYREYHRATTRWAWHAWQARALLQSAPAQPAQDGSAVEGEAFLDGTGKMVNVSLTRGHLGVPPDSASLGCRVVPVLITVDALGAPAVSPAADPQRNEGGRRV
jgi:hypothetical protein